MQPDGRLTRSPTPVLPIGRGGSPLHQVSPSSGCWLEPQVECMHTPYLPDAHADLLPAVLCLHVDLAQAATVEAVGEHHDLSFSVSLKAQRQPACTPPEVQIAP